MNFRLTAIFFGLVIALVAGLLVMVLVDNTPTALTDGNLWGELTKSGVTQKEVDGIELTRTTAGGDEKLALAKDATGKWSLKEPFAGKVDAGAVSSLLSDLFRAKPVPYSELTSSLTIHGLDKPSYRITLKGGDKSATLNLGLSTLGSRSITFVTTSAAPKQPLAVNRQDLSAVFRDTAAKADGEAWKLGKWLADYRIKKPLGSELRDAATEATALTIAQGPQQFSLAKTPGSGGGWTFVAPAGFGDVEEAGDSAAQAGPAPFTGLRPLLNGLTALQTATADDYLEKPEDLSKYGLAPNDPNAVKITLVTKDGPEVLTLGGPVLKDGKPTIPAKIYGKLDGDAGVLLLAYDRLDALKATIRNPGELRNKDLLPEAKRATADAIDLTVGATVMKFRKTTLPGETNATWVLYGGPVPVTARGTDVEQMLTALSKPRSAAEVLAAPDNAAFVDAEKKATVKVWYNGQQKPAVPPKLEPGQLPPEPTLAGTPAELVLGKKEGSFLFVRKILDGKTTDVKVPEAIVVQVAKSRTDWIDPKFKSFAVPTINRLTFNRGAELYDLERTSDGVAPGTKVAWTFVQPASLKGRAADPELVGSILGRLSSLFPESVLNENPTPDDLKKLALDPAAPRMKVTLGTTDAAVKTIAFDFGMDANSGKSIAFRQVGVPFVVQIPRGLFDGLANDVLKDSFAFRLDPAKIKMVKIRGWRDVVGGPTPLTYVLTKSQSGWVLTSPTGVTIDPAKVTELVALLAQPRIDAFVGAPTPAHHISIDQFPEVMEFTIESEGAPTVALVLGNVKEGTKHYAAASTTPGEVLLIDAAAIRKLTEKPLNLQK